MTTTQINVRIDEQLKNDVEPILEEMGLNIADAIRIFLKKVKNTNSIPFALKAEQEITYDDLNDETKKAIEDCEKNINKRKTYSSTKDLLKDCGVIC